MPMPGRSYQSSNGYRYGMNGQEKVDEISGSGNHNTALFWEYDTRTGRRWNLDPKPTIGISDYACFNDNPIWNSDVLGDKPGKGDGDDKKKSESTEKPKEKVLDTKTVGKNWDKSIYMGTEGNPKNTDGTDSYKPKPQENMDGRAKKHDIGSGGIGSRSDANIKEDAVFIVGAISDLAKAVENTFVIPYMGIGDAKPNPNNDTYTNKPISGTTVKRAAAGATAITVVTAAKIALRMTIDPAVKAYDALGDFINEVKYETTKGISDFNNWAPH
jgi:hypothetical protein